MKHTIVRLAALCIILFFAPKIIISSDQTTSTQNKSFLISGPIKPVHKNLFDSVMSYPSMGNYTDENGVLQGQQYIKNRNLAHTVPTNVSPILKNGNFTTLKGSPTDYQNYPTGNALFSDYPALSEKFDKLINLMQTKPQFKAFFNKVHLNILNELYKYLINIYTNFNLQHVGVKEVETKQGATALQFNIPTFLQNELDYSANKKTLIINHFVNIIESQFNGKIKSIMPQVPHLFATSSGKTLIQNDYSIDLTNFILKQVEPDMVKYKQQFLEGIVIYLDFFQEFTSYLMQPHQKKEQHFTAFVFIAEKINDFIYGSEQVGINTTADAQTQTVLKKMNPPLFTFNYDDIRALKLIPRIAQSLPVNTKNITWPAHIIEAANEEISINGHPIAYFTNEAGEVVREDEATHLYVIMQSGKNFFQEELLQQPDWLNDWSGISNVLRGCFGDFTSLLGMNILDPCMEALIQNAVDTMNGKDVNEQNSFANVCQNLIKDHQNKAIAKVPEEKQSNSTSNTNLSRASDFIAGNMAKNNNTLQPTQNIIGANSEEIQTSNNQSLTNLNPSTPDISSALTQ